MSKRAERSSNTRREKCIDFHGGYARGDSVLWSQPEEKWLRPDRFRDYFTRRARN